VENLFRKGDNLKKKDELKDAELVLAASVCCHTSTTAIDHIGEIVQRHSTGSVMEGLRLHRTKCSRLIDHVISPSFKKDLQDDLKDVAYSLIVDESTDVAINKNLCICIVYFSKRTGKVETDFLGLYKVLSATGDALFNTIKEAVESMNLKLDNCIGLGSDGASNMVGENDSVWSRMKAASPNCTLFKCICHSLALCVKHAFEKLPSAVGFLLTEIASWFKISTIRREEYKILFDKIYEPEEGENIATTLPFLKASTTRWLARGKLISTLLFHWSTLKEYFTLAERAAGQESRCKAQIIKEMLFDDMNYLYLVFLSPIVKEFERVNVFFQATQSDPEEIVKQLDILHKSLKQQVIDHRNNVLALSMVDFGASFLSESQRVIQQNVSRSDAVQRSVNDVKVRAHTFLMTLLSEVEKRLPPARNVFRGLNGLSPRTILSQFKKIPFENLPLPHLMSNKDIIETQYRKISLQNWKDETVFDGEVPENAVKFWAGILKYTLRNGEHPYQELAVYALSALSIPVSNAVVERVFSHVTCVKTKYRNRLSLHMMDAILRVRLTLRSKGLCCIGMTVTPAMREKFNSAMYVPDQNIENISALE
jgi:hypothetical protein